MIFSKTVAWHSIAFTALGSLSVRFRNGHAVPSVQILSASMSVVLDDPSFKKFLAKSKQEKMDREFFAGYHEELPCLKRPEYPHGAYDLVVGCSLVVLSLACTLRTNRSPTINTPNCRRILRKLITARTPMLGRGTVHGEWGEPS